MKNKKVTRFYCPDSYNEVHNFEAVGIMGKSVILRCSQCYYCIKEKIKFMYKKDRY